MRPALVLCLTLIGCAAGEPCRTDTECKGDRVCDRGSCVDPPISAVADDLRAPETDAPDLRGPATLPDLRSLADMSLPPDLAPAGCVFDRDCGSGARCCAGTCRAYVDRDNCGACGVSCGADPAIKCCGEGPAARCANVRTEANNCGTCGSVCPSRRKFGTTIMVQDSCCDGLCADLNRDRNNCGSCGNKCPAGQMCYDAGGVPIGGNCG